MSLDPLTSILNIGSQLIDKLIPDKEAANKAKFDLYQLQQQGKLEELQVSMSAIIAEANSTDPWTSRARPSFLYVIYIMLLASIPMGIVSAADVEVAANIATGFKAWLVAIPEPLYALFGVGYVGYAATRSYDKKNGTA